MVNLGGGGGGQNDYYANIIAKNAQLLKTTSKKMFNTVRDLITISIVFTNKNGIDRFLPPPIKDKVNEHPRKTKINIIIQIKR